MSALVDRLIDQLHARGLRIEPGAKPGELRLVGNTKDADEAVLKALRVFKAELLKRFDNAARPEPPALVQHEIFQARVTVETATCELCEREVDATDRASLAGNPLLCDRFGTRSGEPRCPFKESP